MTLKRTGLFAALVIQAALGFPACEGGTSGGPPGAGSCAGQLQWAKPTGSSLGARTRAVAALPDGSSLAVGDFEGSARPGEQILGAAGGRDLLLLRRDFAGQLVWAATAGGAGIDEVLGVAASDDGSFFVVGRFEGTARFGAGEPAEATLRSAGASDVFVARYAPQGTLLWARRAGGPGDDRAHGVALLPDGAVAVAGAFSDAAAFGAGEPNGTTLEAVAGGAAFVARFGMDGALGWARILGGSYAGRALGVAPAEAGGALVTGEVAKSPDAPEREAFAARLGPDGDVAWMARSAGTETACGNAIAALRGGGSLVTGLFRGRLTLGAGEKNQAVLVSAGGDDVLVARYTAQGQLAWARRAGGAGADAGHAIAALPDGGSLVVGHFADSALFGAGDAREIAMRAAGPADLFVAAYAADGRLSWARRAGGSGTDIAYGVAALPLGFALVAGSFAETSVFGPGERRETRLHAEGSEDGFVMLIGP